MQGLARVDIAEAGHDGLVEKRRLEAGFLVAARGGQQVVIERVAERLGADLAHQRMAGEVAARHDQHQTEPARIVVCHRGAGRHMEHHVVMRRGRGACTMELARHPAGIVVAHAERAGHAEMHQQHVPGSKVRRQVFGAAANTRNGLAFQPLREVAGQRLA